MSKKEYPDRGHALPLVEDFYSIQGEGHQTGKAAYFIRIGGCDVGCSWCDTRFSWNKDIHPLTDTDEIVKRLLASGADSAVITGGEPLMWDMNLLCAKLKQNNIKTFLETSGAHPLSGEWDWICLSPKRNIPPVPPICEVAHELKVIISCEDDFTWAEEYSSKVGGNCLLYLQPEWSVYERVIPLIVNYVKEHSKWMISLQAHKFMRIP
ncbi:MAG: 7-carboxy-7-deazaguanine synthase QueE [Bacteroidales bacterium]|nr:7-carboxy-7-deazaguanine synthase QueE [Bacteroidales bacterium]